MSFAKNIPKIWKMNIKKEVQRFIIQMQNIGY